MNRTLNDIDVACYISGSDAPSDIAALLEYLAERLRKAFPNFNPDQVKPQTYSVTVSFRGTGLDVDAPGPVTIPLLDRRFQPQLDQPQHGAVRDATSHRFEEVGVRNRIEVAG